MPQLLRNDLKTALESKRTVTLLRQSNRQHIPFLLISESVANEATENGSPASVSESNVSCHCSAKRFCSDRQNGICNRIVRRGNEKKLEKFLYLEDRAMSNGTLKLNVSEYINDFRRNQYTFVCAREFRRDEYARHTKDVHCVILPLLNQSFFDMCPMARQGCTFSVERMFPVDDNHRIVYNDKVDAFCVTRIQCDISEFYYVLSSRFMLLKLIDA